MAKMTLRTTDHRDYDDDAIFYLKTLNMAEIHLQLQHYQPSAKTRELQIQWGKLKC